MGNTICDRLFISFAEGSDIDNMWSAHSTEALGPWAYLCAAARDRILEKVKDHIDQEMLRFYHASQAHRYKHYESESTADIESLLPRIEPWIAQKYGLGEEATELKELRSLSKESTSCSLVTNEVIYITHLFFLYHSYLEKKRKEETTAKSALMKDVVQAASADLENGLNDKKKEGFVNFVVLYSLKQLTEFGESILVTKDLEKFQKFSMKTSSIIKNLDPEEKPKAQDVALTLQLENLVKTVLKVLSAYKDYAPSADIDYLMSDYSKLTFFVGKLSLHLNTIAGLLHEDLYLELSGNFCAQETKKPDDFSLFKLDTKNTGAGQEIELLSEHTGDKELVMVVDPTKILIKGNGKQAVYSRRPNIGLFPIELSGSASSNQDYYYCSGEIWTVITHKDGSETHRPFRAEEVKQPTEQPFEFTGAVYKLTVEKTLKDVANTYGLTPEELQTYSRKTWTYFSTDKDIRSLTHWIQEGFDIPTLFSITRYERKEGALVQVSEHLLNDGSQALKTLELKDKGIRADWYGDLVIIYNTKKEYVVFDAETGYRKQKLTNCDRAISGFDRTRSRILSLQNSTLAQTRFEVFTSYQFNSSASEAAPNPIQAYFENIMQHVYCVQWGAFNLEFQQVSEKAKLLFQANQVDCRDQTFSEILGLITTLEGRPDFELRDILGLGLFKILDTQLNVASRIQNSTKTDMKVASQENLVKLKKAIMAFKFTDKLAAHQQGIIHYLKLNILSNIISLLTKTKKLVDYLQLGELLFSNKRIYSQQDVSRFLSRLLQLKSKGFAQFDAYMNSLVTKVEEKIAIVCAAEATAFQTKTSLSEELRIQSTNLTTFFSVIVAYRTRMQEELVDKLCEISVRGVQTSLKAICEDLNSSHQKLGQEGYLMQYQIELFSSFTAFILSSVINFMSYGNIWPHMSETLSEMCKQVCAAVQTSMLARPPAATPVSGKDFVQETWVIKEAVGLISGSGEVDVSLPKYNRLKIGIKGADPLFDKVIVGCTLEYDAHNQGREKKITRSIIAPETVLTNDTPIIVDTNRVKIVLISQRREAAFDEDRTIELEVTGEDLALKQTTKLETLIKMCYHFVTHQLLTELRKLDEAKGVMQELPENVAISLESILGSPLFENGVQQPKFSKIDTPNIVVDPEPENEMSEKGTKDRHKEDLCIKGYHHILETLSLKHTEVEGLETLCKQLQTDAATKGMHATLLGELGLILVKSVFVTLLAHSGKLLSIQHTLNSQKPVAVDNELKKLWKECSKIRSIVRAYETDRQFVDIYRKLLLVISIEPSESWNEKYREVDASQPSQEKESINEGVFKMKMYLEELRRNNPGPSNTCNDLGEVLLRLLGLQITVEQIFEILNQRQKHFDLYGVALEMVLNRVRENPTNLHDALLMFNQIFRKSTSEMGNLTPDYAGLSRSSIGNRISQMRELFQGILGYMLQPPAGEEWDNEILLAVESFKWIWRGKEVDCIRVVDVAKIWKICSQRVKDQARFRSSLIDLCFVLLKFCIRKADDLKQEEDEEPVLTLTRSVSVVDENSMSSILNHNFTFLMQVMSENIKELDKTSQVMSSADYSEFLKKLPSDLATKEEYLERLLEASDNDQGKISKIETDNEEKIKLMAKTLEVEVEVFEEEPVEVTEPIQPEVAPIQPEIAPATAEPVAETATQEPTVFSETKVEKVQTKKLIKKEVENPDYQKFKSATAKLEDAQKDYLRNHRQRVNEIQKVLVMFNYYLLEAPDMAALFFDDGPNLEALTQIAFGHYPDSIVVPALRIIQKLMEVLPHHSALSPESGRLGSIFDVLLDHFAALFKPLKSFKRLDHELANSYLEFLRKIMFMPQHQQALISLIKIKCLESTSGPGLLVALALLDHSFGAPLPGSLVYDKLDLMKEQLLVLDKTTNLVAKAYLRDILHYRYDITTDETVSPVRIDRRHLLSSHVLTVCLRTKNYGFLPYHQVARFDPHGLNEQIGKYVDELDLVSRVMKLNNNDSGLLAKFQLVKSLRLTQEKKYRQIVQTLLESIPAIKDKGVSEDDCSYEMNLWLNKCIESPTEKLPALSTQVLKRVSLHDSLRQKTFGVLSALGKLKQEPVSYWGTQFGYFGASGSSQTRNFNIAHHKPSLNSSLDFRPFLSTGRSGATDLLVQGIRHAALLYMFSTRQPADLPKLLLDLSTRLCMIEHKNSNLVEVRDLSTCLNLLLEESENKVLAEQVTALAERRFDIDELPAVHLLLNKISKKLRTIEVSKTYFYRLFDDACQLAAMLEEIEQNNKWVALYVETLENAAELSRLIPKNNLTLDTNRSSKFEAFLTRIEIPHLADSGSFKRLHKQEYVANIMLHFARYVAAGTSTQFSVLTGAPAATREYLKKLAIYASKIALPVKENDIIRALLMKKILTSNDARQLLGVEIPHKSELPYIKLDLSQFSQWMITNPDDIDTTGSICHDKMGRQQIKHFDLDKTGDEFGRVLRLKTEQGKDYYYCCNDDDDLFVRAGTLYQVLLKNLDKNHPGLVKLTRNRQVVVVNGRLFTEDSQGSGQFKLKSEGVTCIDAHKDRGCWVAYQNNTKELTVVDRDNQVPLKDYGRMFEADPENRQEMRWKFDLSCFPEVISVGILGSKTSAYAIDITGGLILITEELQKLSGLFGILEQFDPVNVNAVSNAANPVNYFRTSVPILFLNKQESGERYIVGFGTGHEEITICIGNPEKVTIVLRNFPYKKALVSDSHIFLLSQDGRVFVQSLDECDPEQELREIELTLPQQNQTKGNKPVPNLKAATYAKYCGIIKDGDYKDICLINSTEFMGIRRDEAGNLRITPQSSLESWGSDYATEETRLAEVSPFQNAQFVLQTLPKIHDGNFGKGNLCLKVPYGPGYGQYPVCVRLEKPATSSVEETDHSTAEIKVLAGIQHQSLLEGLQAETKVAAVVKIWRACFYNTEREGMLQRLQELLESLEKTVASSESADISQIQHFYCGYDFKFGQQPLEDTFIQISVAGPTKEKELRDWLKGFCVGFSFWKDDGDKPVHLLPDIFELDDKEFEVLKEKSRELWEEEMELLRPRLADTVNLAREILNKRLAGDENSRTHISKLFDLKTEFSCFSEYDFHFEDSRVDDEQKQRFEIAALGVRLHSYYQFQLRKAQGIYQAKNLDSGFRYSIHKNGVDTFDYLLRLRISGDNYTEITVNRLRGNKYCSLKRQNLSLLNSVCYEVSREGEGWRHRRTRFAVTEFNFVGEAGADAGGPRREYMTQVAAEVYNKLKLFVKSPNAVHNVGEERDKWVPNPKANSKTDLDNLYKVGFVMAIALKHGDCFELSLPSCFWKYLLTGKIEWDDIKCININQHGCLEKMAKMQESDIEYLEQNFTTFLSDGKEYEILPNGRHLKLTAENKLTYVELCKQYHICNLEKAFEQLRRGFLDSVHNYIIAAYSHQELEQVICGANYVELATLKKITVYHNFSPGDPELHPSVIMFWNVLGTFSQEQLASYLRYVWGRSRLSHSISDRHKLEYYPGTSNIPEAHTCFFTLDIGDYPDEENLRKKLLYGMENCTEISETSNRYDFSPDL